LRAPATLLAVLLLGACCASAALAAGSAAGLHVIASTIDGHSVAGTLLELSTDSVTTDESAWRAVIKLPATRLLSVAAARTEQPAVDRSTLSVAIVDGSLLAATSFKAHDGVAEVRLTSGMSLSLPTRRIDWVRFYAAGGDDPLAAQWAEVVAGAAGEAAPASRAEPSGGASSRGPKTTAAAADVLVVRSKQGLDYLEGVAKRVSDESILFEVDQEPVTVKRSRVEGLIYYRAKKEELADAAATVTVRGGTRLQAATLALATDQVKITTPAGAEISLPLDDLDRLDFSSASTQFLSDLQPESFAYVSYFGGKDLPASLDAFYKPRRDAAFDLNPLKLDGKTFAKGLSLHARTTVVYRLPGKFSRLTALVGIDDSVRDAGDVRLEIRGDGKMLWEAAVRGTDHAVPLELSVAGVRRLEILADFGGDFDAGDVIDLCDAKVTR
jgi:hypothetical protein